MKRKMPEQTAKEVLGYVEKELIERIASAQSGYFAVYDTPPVDRRGRSPEQWLAYRDALQDTLRSIRYRLADFEKDEG